jgi:hypothetical protein
MAEKFYGKYRAKVVDINDPEKRGRIRVQCPAVLGNSKSAWCEPCIPYATDFSGDYYVPPINEGIWVEFEGGDPNKPIWTGGWYKIGSTPLLPNSKPDDTRFVCFKDTVIHLNNREVIIELRQGNNTSKVLRINSNTIEDIAWLIANRQNIENHLIEG